jgi:DNA polymerase-1
VFGRRLWLPEIRSSNAGRRQGAERAAINAPMQGTAADLIKRAMLAVQGWLDAQGLKSLLMLQVHDELVLEVPVDELDLLRENLPKLMGGVAQLKVPLLVDGANWARRTEAAPCPKPLYTVGFSDLRARQPRPLPPKSGHTGRASP